MHVIVALFLVLCLLCWFYALRRGGWEGRCTVALLLAATIGTRFSTQFNSKWYHFNVFLFAVDAILLVVLYVIALKSRRYWPIWLAGLQLLVVLSHLGPVVFPHVSMKLYRFLETCWTLPMLVIMTVGIAKDYRRGRRTKVARNAARFRGQA